MSDSDESQQTSDLTQTEPENQDAESAFETSMPDDPRRSSGKKRIIVFALNVALCLVCALLSVGATSERVLTMFPTNPTWVLMLQLCPPVLLLGPLLLLMILSAWGPWHPGIRILLPVVGISILVATQMGFGYALESAGIRATGGILRFLNQTTNWLCALTSAALCLAMVGSLKRLRIGPPEMGPIRITISSILVATAIVGVMISGKTVIDVAWRLQYENAAGLSGSYDAEHVARLQVISLIAFAGPIACVMACCSAAAAFNWIGRLGLVAGPVSLVTLIYVANTASGPPPGVRPSLEFLAVNTAVALILAGLWIALCIRLLHQSGWPCSSRPANSSPH